MALSTAVWVGESKKWIPELIEKAKQLKVNAGKWLYLGIIKVHFQVAKTERESDFSLIFVTMWTLDWILYEPIWKWCRFRPS